MLHLKMQPDSPLTIAVAYITLQKGVLGCCKFHELAESYKFYFLVLDYFLYLLRKNASIKRK